MPTRLAVVAANLAALAFCLLSWTSHGVSIQPHRLDLEIYRLGGRVWLNGGNLYGALPATAEGVRLPFTYPPFAAIVMSALSLIPLAAADLVVTSGTVVALASVLKTFVQRTALPLPPGWLRPLSWLLPVAILLEPVRSTIIYGQINVFLMALVAADCLLLPRGTRHARGPRPPRGSLAGLAAAVKLTPLLFVLYFLVRRDYRAACVMAGSFLTATGIGFLLAPAGSLRYWTGVVFNTGRIGDLAYAGNQSIVGVLARAGLAPGSLAATAVWLGLSTLVLLIALDGMRRAFATGDDCLALVLNAFAALLVSPVSWSHHWVWIVPALLVLAALGHRRNLRAPEVAALAGLVIFAASPQWWFPHGGHRELGWALWEQVAGSSYVIFAVFVLLLCTRWRGHRSRPARVVEGGAVALDGRDVGELRVAALRLDEVAVVAGELRHGLRRGRVGLMSRVRVERVRERDEVGVQCLLVRLVAHLAGLKSTLRAYRGLAGRVGGTRAEHHCRRGLGGRARMGRRRGGLGTACRGRHEQPSGESGRRDAFA